MTVSDNSTLVTRNSPMPTITGYPVSNRNLHFTREDAIVWVGDYIILYECGLNNFNKKTYAIWVLDQHGWWARHSDGYSGLNGLVDMAQGWNGQAKLVHDILPDIKGVAQLVKNGTIGYHIAEDIINNSYFSESGDYIVQKLRGKV